jgi:very-short-patch-repair endonuclease
MADARTLVRAAGGVCTTADLLAAGQHRGAITTALERGEIVLVKRAVRVGGRLACISAARLHGLRVLTDPAALHVHVGPQATRLRLTEPSAPRRAAEPDGLVRLHWERHPPSRGGIVSLEQCLAEMLACVPSLDALCALDSARELVQWRHERPQLLDDLGFARLVDRLPGPLRQIALRSSPTSQAIAETVARERFRVAGIPVTPQAALPGGYWADFLIGERLVFEVDGEGPHSQPGAFDRDRNRWAWLKAIGYNHVSFSHRQVLHQWESVESTVRMLMARGAHLAEWAVRNSGFGG